MLSSKIVNTTQGEGKSNAAQDRWTAVQLPKSEQNMEQAKSSPW